MSTTSKAVFEYGGYHFAPYRQFEKGEGDFFKLSRRLAVDSDLGLSAYRERQKFPYVYKDFYAAATDKKCDIFRCEENGKVYVPGERELFLYREPIERQKVSVRESLSVKPTAESAAPKKHNEPER